MTGLDALRARGRYEMDMAGLRLALCIAQDEGEREREQRIRAAMDARETMRRLETNEIMRLLRLLDPALGRILYLRRLRGLTIRQTAGETRRSVDSVRAMQRRAETRLAGIASALPASEEYADAVRAYKKGL